MKAVELRKKSADELRLLARELAVRRETLELALHQKKLKNVKEIGGVRKDIARVKTVLSEIS